MVKTVRFINDGLLNDNMRIEDVVEGKENTTNENIITYEKRLAEIIPIVEIQSFGYGDLPPDFVPNYIKPPDADDLNEEYHRTVNRFYNGLKKVLSSVSEYVSESFRKYGLGVNMKWHGLTDDSKHKPDDSNDKPKYQ